MSVELALDFFNATIKTLGFENQTAFDESVAQLSQNYPDIPHSIPLLHSSLIGWDPESKLVQGYISLSTDALERIAVSVVEKAPMLVDLKEWMMWIQIFEEKLGGFEEFLLEKHIENVVEIQHNKFIVSIFGYIYCWCFYFLYYYLILSKKYDSNSAKVPQFVDTDLKTPIVHGSLVTAWILGHLVTQGAMNLPKEHIAENIFNQLQMVLFLIQSVFF